MLQIIGVAIVGLIAAVLGLASRKPDELRVRRSARINAPADRIFAHIIDFHKWDAWSPWEKLDPAMTKTHSGPPSGKGAVYEWIGNSKVGQGRMEITDATPPSRVAIALHFIKPFEARNTTEFTLAPAGDATDVTWSMIGQSPFITKVMGVFMDMDKMVGKDFETGLSNLKGIAESR
jgi:hypothetical protein